MRHTHITQTRTHARIHIRMVGKWYVLYVFSGWQAGREQQVILFFFSTSLWHSTANDPDRGRKRSPHPSSHTRAMLSVGNCLPLFVAHGRLNRRLRVGEEKEGRSGRPLEVFKSPLCFLSGKYNAPFCLHRRSLFLFLSQSLGLSGRRRPSPRGRKGFKKPTLLPSSTNTHLLPKGNQRAADTADNDNSNGVGYGGASGSISILGTFAAIPAAADVFVVSRTIAPVTEGWDVLWKKGGGWNENWKEVSFAKQTLKWQSFRDRVHSFRSSVLMKFHSSLSHSRSHF